MIPTKIALVAISGWMNPRTELAYCREHGITVIWLEEIWEHGIAWAVERTLEVVRDGTDGVYLSFDVDSLDAAHAPGTCCPTPGGLTSREAIELVRGVSSAGLLGVDVVEVAPSLDPTPAHRPARRPDRPRGDELPRRRRRLATLRSLLAQRFPIPGAPQANARRAAEIVAGADADLVVLPELWLSGYDLIACTSPPSSWTRRSSARSARARPSPPPRSSSASPSGVAQSWPTRSR